MGFCPRPVRRSTRLGLGRDQLCREGRNIPTRPTTAATAPPMSIQTALSVGDPVKNLETSELKELVALNPMMIRTMPPASSAGKMSLFIKAKSPFLPAGFAGESPPLAKREE